MCTDLINEQIKLIFYIEAKFSLAVRKKHYSVDWRQTENLFKRKKQPESNTECKLFVWKRDVFLNGFHVFMD